MSLPGQLTVTVTVGQDRHCDSDRSATSVCRHCRGLEHTGLGVLFWAVQSHPSTRLPPVHLQRCNIQMEHRLLSTLRRVSSLQPTDGSRSNAADPSRDFESWIDRLGPTRPGTSLAISAPRAIACRRAAGSRRPPLRLKATTTDNCSGEDEDRERRIAPGRLRNKVGQTTQAASNVNGKPPGYLPGSPTLSRA